MSRLVIVPQGGLCNRLRAILSALSLIERDFVDTHLVVGWESNAECAARFDQLFEPLESPHVTIGPRHWTDRPVTRANLHWPALVRCFVYTRQFRNTPPPPDLLRRLCAEGPVKIYTSTGHAFCDYSPDYVRRLRPLPHLQQRIDALSTGFDAHTIGLHIRRTDHTTSIAESPDDLFVEAMRRAIDAAPEARFFLATDDPDLKARLTDRFAGRVITQQCSGTRSDLRGMEEAVVDLWTLARTARIIGSYWSSYTDTAAEIGGIPLTIIRK